MDPSSAIFFRSCNFCGAQNYRLFHFRDLGFPRQLYGDSQLTCPDVGRALKLQYLECLECGLVCLNPLTFFSDINRRRFDGEGGGEGAWDKEARVAWSGFDYDWYEKGKFELAHYYNQYLCLDRYRRLNRFLDVSCGPAAALHWLTQHTSWKVFGVDPDQHSVKTARERYGISITNGLIDDVEEPNESFDVVWMDSAFEHVFDPLGTLLSAFRLLRKGGALILFVPNDQALSVKYLDEQMLWGHWFLYSPLTLFRTLTRIGFSVEKLNASQREVNPRLREFGVDIDAILPAFNVIVAGRQAIEHVLSLTPCYSDYFTIIAIKGEDAPEISPRESELREIASKSLVERQDVDISMVPSKRDPNIDGPEALIVSLEGRLIRLPDSAIDNGKVFFVERGIRRWVLSRKWLDDRGFWFPDDVIELRPELFSRIPEGPDITD
jgi:SAM-dependent methyltransferase